MNLIKWSNSKIKKMGFWDIQFVKISSFAFILMIAKFWKSILILDWYWYALIMLLAAIKPLYTVFKK